MHSVRFLTHDTDTAFLFYIYSTNIYFTKQTMYTPVFGYQPPFPPPLEPRRVTHTPQTAAATTTHHFHHHPSLDVSHHQNGGRNSGSSSGVRNGPKRRQIRRLETR